MSVHVKCMPHEFRCPHKQGEDNEFLGVEVKGGSVVSDMLALPSQFFKSFFFFFTSVVM